MEIIRKSIGQLLKRLKSLEQFFFITKKTKINSFITMFTIIFNVFTKLMDSLFHTISTSENIENCKCKNNLYNKNELLFVSFAKLVISI